MTAYLLCGPSLVGKSTVAAQLAGLTGAELVSADAINAERGTPFGGEGLPESVWAETLRIVLTRIGEAAGRRRSVIVDDTLCYRWLRDQVVSAANAAGLEPVLLLLRSTEAELAARHARVRLDGSRPVLSWERTREHLAGFEWPTLDENPIDISAAGAREAFFARLAAPRL